MHALTQQTPSTQKPVPHSVPAVQVVPLGFRPVWQVPAASQYCAVMLHGVVAFRSCEPGGTFTHEPRLPATLQAWQAVVQVLLQQILSTQKLLVQSVLALQVLPFGSFPVTQLPEPLQDWPAPSQGVVAL